MSTVATRPASAWKYSMWIRSVRRNLAAADHGSDQIQRDSNGELAGERVQIFGRGDFDDVKTYDAALGRDSLEQIARLEVADAAELQRVDPRRDRRVQRIGVQADVVPVSLRHPPQDVISTDLV